MKLLQCLQCFTFHALHQYALIVPKVGNYGPSFWPERFWTPPGLYLHLYLAQSLSVEQIHLTKVAYNHWFPGSDPNNYTTSQLAGANQLG